MGCFLVFEIGARIRFRIRLAGWIFNFPGQTRVLMMDAMRMLIHYPPSLLVSCDCGVLSQSMLSMVPDMGLKHALRQGAFCGFYLRLLLMCRSYLLACH